MRKISIILVYLIIPLLLTSAYSPLWTPEKEITAYHIKESECIYRDYNISAMDWSPNGKNLGIFSLCEGKLVVLDTKTGKAEFSKKYPENGTSYIYGKPILKYSPDGRYLALSVFGETEIINTGTWHTVAKPQTKSINSLSWSSDGKYIVYSEIYGENVTIISTKNWSKIFEFKTNASEAVVSWSPDEKYIAYGSLGNLKIINSGNWNISKELEIPGDMKRICSITWSPNSSYLATAAVMIKNDTALIRIWETATWKEIKTIYFKDDLNPYVLSWNSRYPLLSMGTWIAGLPPYRNTTVSVILINTDNWSISAEFNKVKFFTNMQYNEKSNYIFGYYVTWSPDGNSLAVGCKDVKVYTTEEGLFGTGTQGEGSEIPLLQIGVGSTMIVVIAASIWYWKKRR